MAKPVKILLKHEYPEKVWTVWVGDTEISDVLLTEEDARRLAQQYRDEGFEDVTIEIIPKARKT